MIYIQMHWRLTAPTTVLMQLWNSFYGNKSFKNKNFCTESLGYHTILDIKDYWKQYSNIIYKNNNNIMIFVICFSLK